MTSQHPPGITSGTPGTPVRFQPAPSCTGGSPRTPAALSAHPLPRVTRKNVVLVGWWCLERVEGKEGKIRIVGITHTPQMRKGASSSKGNRKMAVRVFRSSPIVKRCDQITIQSEDGYLIGIRCLLDKAKTLENGFSLQVCECFEFGFPIQWQSLVNPKMVPDNETTTASTPSHSVEYYMEKFLSDSFSNSIRYDFTENDDYSSVGYTGSIGGLSFQNLSNLPDDNAGNITASWGLYGLRMDVSEKSLAAPGEACNNSQESDKHESMQIDACKQDLVNRSISSVSVKQSTGSIGPNSKVDVNILAPSKVMSVVNQSYRSTVGSGQTEKDVDIQQENMHSCSSEHGMVTLPIDCKSSQLGEPGIPNSGKDSVNLWTTDALELPTEGMTPKFGAIGGSEDSTGKRLRSGKVLGMPSGGSMKSHKQKKIQQLESSKQKANQVASSTVDLTSHENDFSAAEIAVEEKLESHDSSPQGRGVPAKGKVKKEVTRKRGRPAKAKGNGDGTEEKRKRKRKRKWGLFSNWV